MSDALAAAFRALPKPDLHLHLMGALRPGTIVDLARRADAPVRSRAERAVAEGFAFQDLSAFVSFVIGLFELVLSPDAFARAASEALEDAARAGARHVELRVTPWSHLVRGADEASMFDALLSARHEAERRHDVTSRIVLDFPRTLARSVAEETLDVALRRRGAGVVALDLAGDEQAIAFEPAFEPVFARARAEGLAVLAHAGEGAGPDSVAGALDRYGARRIGHGTRAVEDPRLVERLAREGVVLEVCPSSNEALGVVASVAEHPVRRLIASGVPVTVATDDPTLFSTDLVREHVRLVCEAAVSPDRLYEAAGRGFDAAIVEPGPTGHALRERLGALAASARAFGASVGPRE